MRDFDFELKIRFQFSNSDSNFSFIFDFNGHLINLFQLDLLYLISDNARLRVYDTPAELYLHRYHSRWFVKHHIQHMLILSAATLHFTPDLSPYMENVGHNESGKRTDYNTMSSGIKLSTNARPRHWHALKRPSEALLPNAPLCTKRGRYVGVSIKAL